MFHIHVFFHHIQAPLPAPTILPFICPSPLKSFNLVKIFDLVSSGSFSSISLVSNGSSESLIIVSMVSPILSFVRMRFEYIY